ncbi:MAG: hypothetical protein JSS53_06205 [Proteobacteria bacterium]|nr:hypothetical protein [Pseudomonadota bacterium]
MTVAIEWQVVANLLGDIQNLSADDLENFIKEHDFGHFESDGGIKFLNPTITEDHRKIASTLVPILEKRINTLKKAISVGLRVYSNAYETTPDGGMLPRDPSFTPNPPLDEAREKEQYGKLLNVLKTISTCHNDPLENLTALNSDEHLQEQLQKVISEKQGKQFIQSFLDKMRDKLDNAPSIVTYAQEIGQKRASIENLNKEISDLNATLTENQSKHNRNSEYLEQTFTEESKDDPSFKSITKGIKDLKTKIEATEKAIAAKEALLKNTENEVTSTSSTLQTTQKNAINTDGNTWINELFAPEINYMNAQKIKLIIELSPKYDTKGTIEPQFLALLHTYCSAIKPSDSIKMDATHPLFLIREALTQLENDAQKSKDSTIALATWSMASKLESELDQCTKLLASKPENDQTTYTITGQSKTHLKKMYDIATYSSEARILDKKVPAKEKVATVIACILCPPLVLFIAVNMLVRRELCWLNILSSQEASDAHTMSDTVQRGLKP